MQQKSLKLHKSTVFEKCTNTNVHKTRGTPPDGPQTLRPWCVVPHPPRTLQINLTTATPRPATVRRRDRTCILLRFCRRSRQRRSVLFGGPGLRADRFADQKMRSAVARVAAAVRGGPGRAGSEKPSKKNSRNRSRVGTHSNCIRFVRYATPCLPPAHHWCIQIARSRKNSTFKLSNFTPLLTTPF